MTLDQVKSTLPNIGDVLYKRPYGSDNKLQCTVTYVNENKLWYEVRFDTNRGSFKECYKLPKSNYHPLSGYINVNNHSPKHRSHPENAKQTIKVKIVETGETFNSIGECARRIGCSKTNIRYALRVGNKINRRYHIVYA